VPLFLLLLLLTFHVHAEPLKVLTENLPPYQIVKNGKLTGGSAFKKVEQVMQATGLEFHFQILPWARAYQMARKDPQVLIFSLARTQQREKHFLWLVPLSEPKAYYFSSLKTQFFQQEVTLETVKQKGVAVARGSAEHYDLLKMGFVEGENLILTVDYMDAWRMLLKNRAVFTYASEPFLSTAHQSLGFEHSPFSKRLVGNLAPANYLAAHPELGQSQIQKILTAASLFN